VLTKCSLSPRQERRGRFVRYVLRSEARVPRITPVVFNQMVRCPGALPLAVLSRSGHCQRRIRDKARRLPYRRDSSRGNKLGNRRGRLRRDESPLLPVRDEPAYDQIEPELEEITGVTGRRRARQSGDVREPVGREARPVMVLPKYAVA
jgi:hypothetical protein